MKIQQIKPVVYVLFTAAVLMLIVVFATQFSRVNDRNSLLAQLSANQSETEKPGVCGPAAKDYGLASTTYEGAFCSQGKAYAVDDNEGSKLSWPQFPQPREHVIWECRGIPEATAKSTECRANRSDIYFKKQMTVTHFGGVNDVRIDRYKRAYERTKDGVFYFGPKRILYPQGTIKGGIGYSETGSVTGVLLRTIDTNTAYAAYPADSILDEERSKTGVANNDVLNNYYLKIDNNGIAVYATIVDRGPGNKGVVDVSPGIYKALGISDGSIVDVEIVRRDSVKN